MFATLVVLSALAQSPPETVHQFRLDYPGGPAPVYVQLDPGEWRVTSILPRVSVVHVSGGGRTVTTVYWPASSWHETVAKRQLPRTMVPPPPARVPFMVNGVASPALTPGGSHVY